MRENNIGRLELVFIPIECHDCSRVQILSNHVRGRSSGEDTKVRYSTSNELSCKGCGSRLRVEATINVRRRELSCTVATENCHMVPVFGLSKILHELAELRRTE